MESHGIIKLSNERVWRTYLGGKLLDEMHGCGEGKDDHFPEEWIASTVIARNVGRENIQNEGLSRIASEPGKTLKDYLERKPETFLGPKRSQKYGKSMGVLVKLIDAAERLTIQVHPDGETAKRLFHSNYGKTECWHILGGRVIDGELPCIYLGFQEGITKERWMELFQKQDIEEMLHCMHRFEVAPGETILIQGGVPHAIGKGCFLAEIQEPTDFTIRVERTTPSKLKVDDFLCHQGLGFEKMFDCFSYEGMSREETYRKWFLSPRILEKTAGGEERALVTYKDTKCFRMNRLEVSAEWAIPESADFSVIYVLGGNGIVQSADGEMPLQKGDQFFLPPDSGEMIVKAQNKMEILRCFGPEL